MFRWLEVMCSKEEVSLGGNPRCLMGGEAAGKFLFNVFRICQPPVGGLLLLSSGPRSFRAIISSCFSTEVGLALLFFCSIALCADYIATSVPKSYL